MSDDPLGLQIPDEHVGPFIAEVFEDAERDTSWESVVGAMVAPESRDAWDGLSPGEQAIEVLKKAAQYNEQAIDHLESIPTDGSADAGAIEEQFGDARRCRRNADTFRDGIASAFGSGYFDSEVRIEAIEAVGFDTRRLADREEALERVANHFDFDFQPYGGILIESDERIGEQQSRSDIW